MIQATHPIETSNLVALPMTVNSNQSTSENLLKSSQQSAINRSHTNEKPMSPRTKAIIREAEDIKHILMQLSCLPADDLAAQHSLIEQHEKIKHLNSFGKQLLIRMFRSNDRFWGYKVDFDQHILKPSVLFLVGTLCDSFDYMNTSPIFGLSVLDVGCGALSTYGVPDKEQDLLTQFYADRPPIATEMLQMLGAKTIGLDPRANRADEYKYDVAYKHFKIEFDDIDAWLQNSPHRFDVISCMNLFNRQSFLYDHNSYEDTADFFEILHKGLATDGLLYTSPPMIPSSEENRCTNRRIFTRAGFRILHEGYFLILTQA